MPDSDIETLADVVDRRVPEVAEAAEDNERAREAIEHLRKRIAVADDLYDLVATHYTLVWPIPGVLMSARHRRRAIANYARLNTEAGRSPSRPAGVTPRGQ